MHKSGLFANPSDSQFIKISTTHWGACANRLTNNNKMQMPTLLFLG